MPFLSEFINKTVLDSRGDPLGKCVDVYVNVAEGFPEVVALGLSRGGQEYLISAQDLVRMDRKGLLLSGKLRDLTVYEPNGDEIGLARKVLDRQIIDINGRRVVRVNDLQFARTAGKFRLVGVDATPEGLARRIGLERPIGRVLKTLGLRDVSGTIPWDQVDPTAIGPAGIPLKVARNDLTKLHEADLADILEALDVEAQDYVLSTLDPEMAAETLSEMDPERQAAAIESIEPERAADILDAMPPDEAADILGDISPARAADLLNRMEADEAEDVRELLAYQEDSAGGIMTNEFITIPVDLTAAGTLQHLRQIDPESEGIHYLYITDAEERLLGVISLWRLILAEPDMPVSEFMVAPVISVQVTDSKEDVAATLAKYNLLAVPVIDAEGRILGIVTVDDAIESVIPATWMRRLPRVFS
ncbi:MAG: CBS domain-containing protein [Chloroflexota bacterium]|nr:CBS domain-containing protein [Chloroflexota bacterium]MDQ5866340.1 CBS domain-containing protein [Chloroflexota bacterium]